MVASILNINCDIMVGFPNPVTHTITLSTTVHKAEKLSVRLSVFWHADNSVVSKWQLKAVS